MNDARIFHQLIKDFFKALGNEKRQEIILNVFADYGEHNIGEVARRVKIAQSTASEHLSLLKRAGLLVSRKLEKEVLYTLDRKGILGTLDEVRTMLSCCKEEQGPAGDDTSGNIAPRPQQAL